MEDKKVAILMSTYNGEKFIKEQINSLINQTYSNIEIYIRDDGSTDGTVEILKNYIKEQNNIIVRFEKNIGFIDSFFELLTYCKDADYYAYCDQDDIWMNDKIERAVGFLENNEFVDKPTMYFSNSDYYDMEMNYIATANKNKMYNFRNAIVENVTQGMTMVVNECTRKYIVENKPKNCLYHDWWTYMICSGCGKIVYDDKSLVKYRRHSKSVTAEGKSKISILGWRIKEFLIGDSLKKIKMQLREFESIFGDKLNQEDRNLLSKFTINKYNFFIALEKVFYKKRFRSKLIDELYIRILFVLGKL